MRRAAVFLAALVMLGGCGADTMDTTSDGSGSADSPAATSTKDVKAENSQPTKHMSKEPTIPANAPACAAVWKDGAQLARDYDGCMSGKRFVVVDQEPCSFGQRLVRYEDHYYAVRGGPVNRTAAPLAKDRDYRHAIASCRA